MTPTIITQKDLCEAHGWSRYLIRMLCKDVSFSLARRGLRLYIIEVGLAEARQLIEVCELCLLVEKGFVAMFLLSR